MRKILAIDGGGIKGVFPAAFLASLEESLECSVADYFDLIVGTSTGGIIAIGLGLGLSAKEILRFYEEHGPSIFRTNWIRQLLSLGILPKYDRRPLEAALMSVFGNRILGESKKRLVIPSANLELGEVYVFKTAHHPRFERDHKTKVVDVAMATAAAPSYFPVFRNRFGTPLIDGGVWANNPLGFAVLEAITVLRWERNEIRALSLGCTLEPLDVGRARSFPVGRLYWGTKIVDVFMSLQSSASNSMAQWIVGTENVYRINPCVPTDRFRLDVVKEIESLKGLGDSEARKALPMIRERFLTEPAEVFVPTLPKALKDI